MKILVISNMYPSASDPVYGTFVKTFFDEISNRNSGGINHLVAIKGKRVNMFAKIGAYFKFYVESIYYLLFHRYDLVYVHTITFPIIPIRIVSLFRRLPLVFNVHGGDVLVDSSLKRFLKNMSRPMLSKARMIVVPSKYFRSVMLSEFPELSSDLIFVSPSGGISKSFFMDEVAEIHETEMPSDNAIDGGLTLGYVSRIDDGKGWDIYLNAICNLRQRGVKCVGLMVGSGAQVSEMLGLRRKLGLDAVVDYYGPVPHDELPSVAYRRMDMLVFPTRKAESLGLVGLEAMASYVPVIATDIGGPSEYVVNGVNGYLFTQGSYESLVERVICFMGLSSVEKDAMGDAAYQTACCYRCNLVNDELYAKLLLIAGRKYNKQ